MSLFCFYLVSPPILSVLMQVRPPSKYGFGSPVTLLPRLISFHSSWLTFLNIRRICVAYWFSSVSSVLIRTFFQILQLHGQVPSKAVKLESHHHAGMLGTSLRRGQRPGQRISSSALSMISLSWGDAWAREAGTGERGVPRLMPHRGCFTGQATVYECTRVRTEKKYAVPWTLDIQPGWFTRDGAATGCFWSRNLFS